MLLNYRPILLHFRGRVSEGGRERKKANSERIDRGRKTLDSGGMFSLEESSEGSCPNLCQAEKKANPEEKKRRRNWAGANGAHITFYENNTAQ